MSKVDALRALREGRHAEAPSGEEACGHRNMGGKTCTRPAGHAESSHRYTAKP